MPDLGALTALAIKHKSDKWGQHSYTRHYECYLAPFRDKPIKLLEIGIGGYEDPQSGGSSIKMWRDYFSLAHIYALDIVDKSSHAGERVSIYQGSQTDRSVLRQIHLDSGGLDIIIDDGSHEPSHIIESFEYLFPLMNPVGIYIVEDVQTSYWPAFGGSTVGRDLRTTTVGYFKSLIHGLNYNEFIGLDETPSPTDTTTVAIHFYHNLVILEKGDNTEPSNVPWDHPARRSVR